MDANSNRLTDVIVMDTPPGRRFMSQGGGDPKWVTLRIGPLTMRHAPVRVENNRDHHKHLGYVAILGVAVGMLALTCFYFCVWLVRRSQSRHWGWRPPLGGGSVEGEAAGDGDEAEKVRGTGAGEPGVKAMLKLGEVELVLMAGEHVPTFLAHPLVKSI